MSTSHPRFDLRSLTRCSLIWSGLVAAPAAAQAQQPAAAPATLPETVVTAERIDEGEGLVRQESAAATRIPTPLIETPQSVSVIPREEFALRGADSLNEVLGYTAGVLAEPSGLDSRADEFLIRGFESGSYSNNGYLDGLRLPTGNMWTVGQLDVFGFESVEVVKGPSAVTYGQVAPGGLINRATKRPTGEFQGQLGSQWDSLDAWKFTGDASGPLTENGRVLGRLVTSYRFGGTEVDFNDRERFYLAPSLTFNFSGDTSLTAYAIWQEDWGGSTFQFLPIRGTLEPTRFGYIDRQTFLGDPDYNRYDRSQVFAGTEFKHRFNEVFSLFHNLRYGVVDTEYEAVIGTQPGLLPDDRSFTRRAVYGQGTAENLAIDTRLQAEFATGAVEHTAVGGVDVLLGWLEDIRRDDYTVPPVDVFDPSYAFPANYRSDIATLWDNDGETEQYGFYLQDQVEIGRLHLSLGGRYDQTEYRNHDRFGGEKVITDPDEFTWRVGALYAFDNGLSPYASYSTSFEPLTSVDGNGDPFDPTTGKQWEVGVKYQPKAFDALFTLAYFDLTQENLLTTDPTPPAGDPFALTQAGEVEIRGVELEGRAELAEGLQFIGALTWLDSEITRDNDGFEGKRFANVPDATASAWLDYTFGDGTPLAGLGLGSGVRFVGQRYGEIGNENDLPSFTLWDAAIRYDLGRLTDALRGATLSVSVQNLLDEDYVATATRSINAHYGAGRVITVGLNYTW